ncbi:MAG: hypothetical protein ACYCZ6_02335 [Polaromonas sp.]
MNTQSLFLQSELALAAYATLTTAPLENQTTALKDSDGMSAPQAESFATRYSVVTQYNDTLAEGGLGTSFSATVFKDAAGNLTLAIRGTADLGDTPTDTAIATTGAGYDQIVAMWNWWQRASAPANQTVAQVKAFASTETPPAGSVGVYSDSAYGYYLVPAASSNVTANGLLSADSTLLAADADHQLNVTGHSLGGHLAMAFGALFPTAISEVATFNAPGFKTNPGTQQLFAALGGSVPSGTATTNVIADEASIGTPPWTAVAGLNSRPGTAVNIAIENQWLSDEPNAPSAKNHSQQILTDSLAVYNTLSTLDTDLTASTYKSLLAAAVVGTAASYERILDALNRLLGSSQTALPAGNNQRDALYSAMYAIQANSAFATLAGQLTIKPANAGDLRAAARNSFAALVALQDLSPVYISGKDAAADAVLATVWQSSRASDYAAWTADKSSATPVTFTDNWLTDRAAMLAAIVYRNQYDSSGVLTPNPTQGIKAGHYLDVASNTELTVGLDVATTREFAFGSAAVANEANFRSAA